MSTPKEIAEWMVEKMKDGKPLYQDETAYKIKEAFGEEFTYINDNGNLALDKRVTREFLNLTRDTVVWERSEFCWRLRKPNDPPGKRQVD